MAKLSNTNEQVAVVDAKRKPTYTIISEEEDEDDIENRVFEDGSKNSQTSKKDSKSIETTKELENEGNELESKIGEIISKKDMLFLLLNQAGPVTVSFFLGFAGTFTQLIFASHFTGDGLEKSTVFAGISLANMFANVSCMSLMIGKILIFESS